MEVNLEEKSGATVVNVSGDIDINSSPELKQSFEKVVKEKSGNVVIDLSRVGYVDSSGLATLVEILKKIKNAGGRLKLSSLSEKVLGLFEITKLNKLFDIAADVEGAINSF